MSENFFDLSGNVAIVTGASRGLGQYFARALGRAGAKLIVTARNAEDCGPFLAELAGMQIEAKALQLDVRNLDSITAFGLAAESAFGKVDILVNNAGLNIRKPALDITWDDWNTVLETNLRGTFFVSQSIARGMIERRYGRIINISSVTSVFGYAGLAPYGASRGGVRQLTMSLADDWGPHGVTVNALAPGWFRTEQNRAMYEDSGWVEYLVERIPAKRPGAPNDLDGAIVFLASEASRYMTGQNLLIDGGISVGATRAMVKQGP